MITPGMSESEPPPSTSTFRELPPTSFRSIRIPPMPRGPINNGNDRLRRVFNKNVQKHVEQFGPVQRHITPKERFDNLITEEERQAGLARYSGVSRYTAEMLIRREKIQSTIGDDRKSNWARRSIFTYQPNKPIHELVTA